MKYTAIIIDDEINATLSLSASIQELLPEIEIRRTCTNWNTAFEMLKTEYFDFIFLDISMPGKTGLELLRLLPELTGDIIFVTAHEAHALEAFKLYASGYLLKPVDDAALYGLLSKIISHRRNDQNKYTTDHTRSPLLGIASLKGIDYARKDEIVYLKAEHGCTRVVLKDRVLCSSHNLARFQPILDEPVFFQVHRSYIINLDLVRQYRNDQAEILMKNGDTVPVARTVRYRFLEQFAMVKRNV